MCGSDLSTLDLEREAGHLTSLLKKRFTIEEDANTCIPMSMCINIFLYVLFVFPES